jgi:predicted acylesterase/phospholipase RssA
MASTKDSKKSVAGDKHRALALSGGGPAVGTIVGFLQALDQRQKGTSSPAGEPSPLHFDVWSMSCVGAWAGSLYWLSPDRTKRYQFAHDVVRGFFRPDDVYDLFPTPTAFLPDVPEMIESSFKFLADPRSYANLVVPAEIHKGYRLLLDTYLAPSKWNPGDFANLMLNGIMAPNPFFRLMMGLMYKTDMPGLSKLWFGSTGSAGKSGTTAQSAFTEYRYPDGRVVKLDLEALEAPDVPVLYHNAYDIDIHTDKTELFSNRGHEYRPNAIDQDKDRTPYKKITFQSLCACSGLPYILSPVEIDGTWYVEGATVDTISFSEVLDNHPELDEIWVSNILSRSQLRRHQNVLHALQNLIMMFACTAAEDKLKLFKYDLRKANEDRHARGATQIKLHQLPVGAFATFDWTESNFDNSVASATKSAGDYLDRYVKARTEGTEDLLSDREILV